MIESSILDMSRHYAPVSVVLPVYRGRNTIERAIVSVARQSLMPIELIVVDDASDDGTPELVSRLGENFPTGWLKLLVLKENQGVASARNYGWSFAKGKFIAFLDADDEWYPEKIDLQYSYMLDHPEVVLCGHGHSFSLNRSQSSDCSTEVIGVNRILLLNPFVTPSTMIRADIVLRFQSGKRHVDDHLLWMQVALSGMQVRKIFKKLVIVHKPLYGESGLSAQMLKMEKAELENYIFLYKSGYIGFFAMSGLLAFSLIKFFRRLMVVAMRYMKKSWQWRLPK
jgi:glycosyltransferase involved in cell wall biosynthesis